MEINHYEFKYGEFGETTGVQINLRGYDVLRFNNISKGPAFTIEERQKLKLSGFLPPRVKTLDDQIRGCLAVVRQKATNIDRYIYLRNLFDRNVVLFNAVVASNVTEFLPIIYTPTVGIACQQYSKQFRGANGIHFYPGNIEYAEYILRNYTDQAIRIAVVTDNQGILGIGDQGAGGIPICLGKLMLYTQGAGIAPWHCMPVSLDVGTDNPDLINDPDYIGWRHERIRGREYEEFIDKFVTAFKRNFPHALLQWEDFSKQTAFTVRDKYVNEVISFNDDIQGTGAIALAGIIAAMKVKGEKLKDQIYLIHGAGAGGIGIAEQILTELKEQGMAEKEAISKIFTLDSKGVVTTDKSIEPYKIKFAKDPGALSWLKSPEDNTLLNAIKNERVTVLIGTSGTPGCFTREIVEAMCQNTERPLIFPLSNPNKKTEAQPQDIYTWTNGKALVASGSPFPPVAHLEKTYRIGQVNNAFVFPGVGLGVIASGAKEVLPSFFSAAAHAVAGFINEADLKEGILCPPLDQLRAVSFEVAKWVGAEAIRAGVTDGGCRFASFRHNNDTDRLNLLIDKMRWKAEYLPQV